MRTTPGLSKRENQIAELIAWGATKKEIANMLFIAEDTVENHVKNIYAILNIHSVGQLSSWWFCTRYHISFDLSPLKKKIVALCLLAILLPAEIFTCTNFTRLSRTNITLVTRPTGRRAKRDPELSDLYQQ